jgi:hypothetical protein
MSACRYQKVSVRPYFPTPLGSSDANRWGTHTSGDLPPYYVMSVVSLDIASHRVLAHRTAWAAPEHTHPPTGSALLSWTEKPFRDFGSETVFSFWMPERSLWKQIKDLDSVMHHHLGVYKVLTPHHRPQLY